MDPLEMRFRFGPWLLPRIGQDDRIGPWYSLMPQPMTDRLKKKKKKKKKNPGVMNEKKTLKDKVGLACTSV